MLKYFNKISYYFQVLFDKFLIDLREKIKVNIDYINFNILLKMFKDL